VAECLGLMEAGIHEGKYYHLSNRFSDCKMSI
jgi:hypothetical protein